LYQRAGAELFFAGVCTMLHRGAFFPVNDVGALIST
jgi:hypothetical protein